MKPEEAIRIKERTFETSFPVSPEDIYKADQLSIEALKYYQKVRADLFFGEPLPLPGETKD